MIKSININGVGYNTHSLLNYTKAEWIELPFHNCHRLNLIASKRRIAILEAAEILTPYFKKDEPNINTDDKQSDAVNGGVAIDGEAIGGGNEGSVSKPKRRAVGKRNK